MCIKHVSSFNLICVPCNIMAKLWVYMVASCTGYYFFLLKAFCQNNIFIICFICLVFVCLQQAANALSEIEQPSTSEAARKLEAIKNLEVSTEPLREAIVHGLLHHKDKEVRLLVAICISEIFRIMAPEPPFEDKYLRVTCT